MIVGQVHRLPSIWQAERFPYKFHVFQVINSDGYESAVNDVQRPLLDIERGFSDGLA